MNRFLLFLLLLPGLAIAQNKPLYNIDLMPPAIKGLPAKLTSLSGTVGALPAKITQQQRRVDSLATVVRSLSITGASTSIAVGTTTNLAPGSAPYVGTRLSNGVTYLDFGLAPGLPGLQGVAGPAGLNGITPSLSIGSVSTGAAGSAAVVTLSGSTTAPVLNITVPKGDLGATGSIGPPGVTPQLSVGTVTTGTPGSSAAVTIGGSTTAPVLNITIPAGTPGPPGSASGTVTQVNGKQATAGAINIIAGDIPYGAGNVADALNLKADNSTVTSVSNVAASALSAANSATATGAANTTAIAGVASNLASFTGNQNTRDGGQDSQIAGKLPVSYSATQASTDAAQNSSISSASTAAASALSAANSATLTGQANATAIATKADNATVLTGLALRGVSITDYGAVPGGNINAALTAALNSNASTILIPPSTVAYLITGPLSFSNLTGKTIIATGATILNTTTSLGYLFQNCQKINIQGGKWGLLTTPTTNGGNSQHVFQFDRCQGVTLNNRFEIINSAEMGTAFTGCRDVLLDNVYIHNTFRDGAYFRYFNNVTVINSRFDNIKDDAISLHDKDNFDAGIDAGKSILSTYRVSQSTGAIIQNNIFTDVYQAVAGIAPKDVKVLTNNIKRTVIAAIAFYQIKNDTTDHAVVSDLIISGNTLDSTNRGAVINGTFYPNNGQAGTGRAAIFIGSLGTNNQLNMGEAKRLTNVTVSENTISASGANAYWSNLVDGLHLSNNTFINCSGANAGQSLDGIPVELQYCTRLQAVNNTVNDTRSTVQHVWAYKTFNVTGYSETWNVNGVTTAKSLILVSALNNTITDNNIPIKQADLSSNTANFNNVLTPGYYLVSGNGSWTGSTNPPASSQSRGNLEVIQTTDIVTQRYTDYQGLTAIRVLSSLLSGSWSSWNYLVSASDAVAGKYGIMNKSTYDANTNNIVDNSEALNGQAGAYYQNRANHTGTQPATTITTDATGKKVITGTTLTDNLTSIDVALLGARSTGLISGGQITINTGNNTRFDVAAGVGQILDNTNPASPVYTPVNFSASTLNTPLGEGQNYVYRTSTGAVAQQSTAFTPADYRTKIVLGRVTMASGVITSVQPMPIPVQNFVPELRDLADGLGIFIVSGLRALPNSDLSFQLTSGKLYSHGSNFYTSPLDPSNITIAGASPKTFGYLLRAGTSASSSLTAITPAVYDNNGTLTAVPGGGAFNVNDNDATNQRVYLFPSGNVRILYGQQIYQDLATAVAAASTETFVVNPNVTNNGIMNGILIGVISVARNATSLQDAGAVKFTAADRFGQIGGSGGNSSTTYDGSETKVVGVSPVTVTGTGTTTTPYSVSVSTLLTYPATISASTYTLTASDLVGNKMLQFSNACTVTVPASMPVGSNVLLRQTGTGVITLSAGSGATLNKYPTASTTSSGQNSMIGIDYPATSTPYASFN